jgi:hypothetical protein
VNPTGLYLGVYMLLVIGIGFVWVIQLEYHAGAGIWKFVLALGLAICLVSLFVPGFTASALVGIFGGSVVWGATELPGQADRVRRGVFPANPRRAARHLQK